MGPGALDPVEGHMATSDSCTARVGAILPSAHQVAAPLINGNSAAGLRRLDAAAAPAWAFKVDHPLGPTSGLGNFRKNNPRREIHTEDEVESLCDLRDRRSFKIERFTQCPGPTSSRQEAGVIAGRSVSKQPFRIVSELSERFHACVTEVQFGQTSSPCVAVWLIRVCLRAVRLAEIGRHLTAAAAPSRLLAPWRSSALAASAPDSMEATAGAMAALPVRAVRTAPAAPTALAPALAVARGVAPAPPRAWVAALPVARLAPSLLAAGRAAPPC